MKENFGEIKKENQEFTFSMQSSDVEKNHLNKGEESFEGNIELSESFLKNLKNQIETAKNSNIWKISLLDDEGGSNLNAGYPVLEICPSGKFPISAEIVLAGSVEKNFDDEGNEVPDPQPEYHLPVFVDENYKISSARGSAYTTYLTDINHIERK